MQLCIKPNIGFIHELWKNPYEGGVYMIGMTEQIQETLADITTISADINIRQNNVMIMFEYVVPDEETSKKIETALSQFGDVEALHCREYGIVCWLIR